MLPDQPQSIPTPEDQSNKEIEIKSKKPKEKKRVQFQRSESGSSSINATIAGYIPLRSEITSEEQRTTWWNKNELEQLMLSARSMCRSKRDDLQMGSNLIKAYDAVSEKVDGKHGRRSYNTTNNGSSDQNDGSEEEAADFNIEDRHIQRAISQLQKWELNIDHRGLETWSSYEHELSRENAQRELTRMVLSAQRTHRMRYGRICKEGTEESEVLWNKVHDVSNRHSRHARIFAYTMGQADAVEAGIEIYPKKPRVNIFRRIGRAVTFLNRSR